MVSLSNQTTVKDDDTLLRVGDIVQTTYGNGILMRLDARNYFYEDNRSFVIKPSLRTETIDVCQVELGFGKLYASRDELIRQQQLQQQKHHDQRCCLNLATSSTMVTPYGPGRLVEYRHTNAQGQVCVVKLDFGATLYAPLATFLQQQQQAQEGDVEDTNEKSSSSWKAVDMARKAAVGVVGGSLTVVGAIMIPLPTPFGAVIAGSGMALLGTEFEEAAAINQRVMDAALPLLKNAKKKLTQRKIL